MSYSGGTEAVTVYGNNDGGDFNPGEYASYPGYPDWLNAGANANSPWEMYGGQWNDPSAAYDISNIGTGGFTPNYFANLEAAQTPAALPVESVTVEADAQPQEVAEPTFSPAPAITTPGFTPNYFDNLAAQSNVESVTVTAPAAPEPQLVQAPNIPPIGLPTFWPGTILYPDLPDGPTPAKPKAVPKSPGGGSVGGAGAGISPPQKPQQPLQQVLNLGQQLTPAQLAALLAANRGQVTAAQQAALAQLTPAQLAALLQNPNLTAAQKAAVQQALAQKLQQPVSAGGAGLTAAAAQKAAAAAASPFQGKAAILPAILIGGVFAAYAITHRHEISKQVKVSYAAAKRHVRRVRRVLA